MHRRILFAAVTACLAGAMTLAAASTASAAPKKFPSQTGPGGVVRAAGTGQSPGRRRRPGVERAVPVPGRAAGAVVRQQRLPAAVLRRQPDHADPGDDRGALRRLHRQRRPTRCREPTCGSWSGRTVLTSTQGQKRRVAAIAIHPRWNPDTFSQRRRDRHAGRADQRHPADLGGDGGHRRAGAARRPAHGHRLGQHDRPAGRTRWRRRALPGPHAAGQGPGGQPGRVPHRVRDRRRCRSTRP